MTETLTLVLKITDDPEHEQIPRYVTAEVTSWDEISPALAVTPALAGWPAPAPIPGWWRVTHRLTGRSMTDPCCRDCARAVGLGLAGLPVPWGEMPTTTVAAQVLDGLPDARRAIAMLRAAAAACDHTDDDEGTS